MWTSLRIPLLAGGGEPDMDLEVGDATSEQAVNRWTFGMRGVEVFLLSLFFFRAPKWIMDMGKYVIFV